MYLKFILILFYNAPYDATKFIDELKYHYPSNINATIEFEPILPQWLLSLLPFQCGNPPVFQHTSTKVKSKVYAI